MSTHLPPCQGCRMNRLCDRTEARAIHPPEPKPPGYYHDHIIAAAVIASLAVLAVLIFWV